MSRRCGGYHRVAASLEVLGQVPRRWSGANFQLDFRHRDLHLLVMLCSLLGTTAQPSGIIGAFVSRIWRIQQVPSSETALPLPACWPRRQVAPSACGAHEPGVASTAASNCSRVCTHIARRFSYLRAGQFGKAGSDIRLRRLLQVPAPAAQLTKVLAGLRHTFVVADATLPDCPLVYASEG